MKAEVKANMSSASVSQLAYYLALIGGIIMVLIGILGLIGYSIEGLGFHFYRFAYSGIVTLICGIIAVIGAKSVKTVVWSIVLIIVGVIGGTLGGLLVLIGGIIGLIIFVSHGKV
jgi:hypothetical protein